MNFHTTPVFLVSRQEIEDLINFHWPSSNFSLTEDQCLGGDFHPKGSSFTFHVSHEVSSKETLDHLNVHGRFSIWSLEEIMADLARRGWCLEGTYVASL